MSSVSSPRPNYREGVTHAGSGISIEMALLELNLRRFGATEEGDADRFDALSSAGEEISSSWS